MAAYDVRISDWSSDVCSSDLPFSVGWVGSALHPSRLARPPQRSIEAHGLPALAGALVVVALELHHPAEFGGVPGALLRPPVAVHLLGDAQQHEGVEGSGRHGDPLAVQHLDAVAPGLRSEEHTSELQSLMRNTYHLFSLKKKQKTNN